MSDDPNDRGKKKVGYKSPPVEHQIKKGERRNPNGRRGKGKPSPTLSEGSTLATIILEEMARRVPQGDGTEIEMNRRVVQAATLKAANGNLPAARLILTEYRRVEERRYEEQKEILKVALDYRFQGLECFADHRRRCLSPPDIIPHPSHVIIEGDQVRIVGPLDHQDQLAWERLKHCVVMFTEELAWAREKVREFPDDEWAQNAFKSAQKLRRKVMRMVPKGWNWREEIWNRASVDEDRARDMLLRKIENERTQREQDQA